MDLTPEHEASLIEVLRWRRDVRHFRTDPIPADKIARLEQAMALAPSVGNSRPWRVVQVSDAAARDQIIASFECENRAAGDQYDGKRREDYFALKLAGLREAPVHLAVFTETAPAEGHGLGRQTMPETLSYSTVMAIHTLWLVARAMNIGVGWVSILDPEVVAKSLGVDASWALTAYLCLGYPLEAFDTPELERRGWQANCDPGWIER